MVAAAKKAAQVRKTVSQCPDDFLASWACTGKRKDASDACFHRPRILNPLSWRSE